MCIFLFPFVCSGSFFFFHLFFSALLRICFVASFVLFALLLRNNCCCKAALKVHLLVVTIFFCSLIFLSANFASLLVRLLYLRKRLMWQNRKEISLLLVLQRKI
uniref:Uncharacterized protein n=1 Tax=Salix viminalis TaxID=40686 RepID=A0A6N2MM23_SALVM